VITTLLRKDLGKKKNGKKGYICSLEFVDAMKTLPSAIQAVIRRKK